MVFKRRLMQLLLSSMLIIQGIAAPIFSAQEPEMVHYQMAVMLNLPDQTAVAKTDLSYDIIDKATNQIVWSFRNGAGNPEQLALPMGQYRFRLYHWDQVEQAGAIVVDELDQSIAEPTEAERNENKTLRRTHAPGQVNVLGDGSVVYDIDFEVKITDELFDDATQQYQSQFTLYIADPQTAHANDGQNEPPIEETTQEAQNGEIHLVALDSETEQLLEGVQFDVAGTVYTTDVNGQVNLLDVAPGEYVVNIVGAPEGYAIEMTETLVVEAGQPVQFAFKLNKAQAPVSEIHLVALDAETEQLLEGVQFDVAGTVYTTDVNGQVNLLDVAPGEYVVNIVGAPEGYAIEMTETLVVEAGQPVQFAFKLNKAQAPVSEIHLAFLDSETEVLLEGVQVEISGNNYTSNIEGQVNLLDVIPGEYTINFVAAPEGYSLPRSETIDVVEGQPLHLALRLTKDIVPPQVASIIFEVKDNNGNPVPNTTILMDGVERTTDENGFAQFNEVISGDYTYEIVGLPNSYTGNVNGTVQFDANQGDLQVSLAVEKSVQTGKLRYIAKDTEGNPVANVGISMLGNVIYTKEDGIIEISDLELNDYGYEITEIPEGYKLTVTTGQIAINAPDQMFDVNLTFEKEVKTGTVVIKVVDQNQQPVENVKVLVDEITIVNTNPDGQALVDSATLGQHDLQINELPEGYTANLEPQAIEVVEGEQVVTLAVTAEPKTQKVKFLLVDQFNKPVVNATVELDGQTAQTNAEGIVEFDNVKVGNQTYRVSNLPEKFESTFEDVVEVTADRIVDQAITVIREVTKGNAILTVVNQNQQPLANVAIKFGGLSGTTNTQGQVEFKDLDLGNYYYSATSADAGITLTGEERLAEITEGLAFTDTIVLQQELKGSAQIIVLDASNRPITNVEISLGNQIVRTNAEGVAQFSELPEGDYTFAMTLIEGYQFNQTSGTINIIPNEMVTFNILATPIETTTVATTTITAAPTTVATTQAPTTTVAPAQTTVATTQAPVTTVTTVPTTVATTQAPITTTAVPTTTTVVTTQTNASTTQQSQSQAMKQFVDSTSNVEVWVHPDDVAKVSKLQVTRGNQNLPATLVNKDVELFNVRLLDANGQDVVLTKTVQVKIPTRLVNTQIQLLRIEGQQLTSISHTIHNQRANFTTQQLGLYGLVYGDRVQATTETTTTTTSPTVAVVTATSVERKIPNTGEKTSLWVMLIATLSIVIGASVILKTRSENE